MHTLLKSRTISYSYELVLLQAGKNKRDSLARGRFGQRLDRLPFWLLVARVAE